MAAIVPTILAKSPEDYKAQLERVEPFSHRIHVDFVDGHLAKVKTIDFEQAWWPGGHYIDLHVMYQRPVSHLKEILSLKPHLVVVHAEAQGNFVSFAQVLHKYGIKVGVALLPETAARTIAPVLDDIDHVLIFSGHLGHFGGRADLELLTKAQALKEFKPSLEIGWDGGINDTNVHLLAAGGVDVLNVGGYIQKSPHPAAAYAKLKGLIKS